MEEKGNKKAKENNNREDNHFSDKWYRDGARLGYSAKLPHSIVDKNKDAREQIYKEFEKMQNAKKTRAMLAITIVSIGVIYLVLLFGFNI
tara:strand:- start:297 stop:566 length:270 start_codon:yes stop_codon:yes gene_type:complete